MDCTPLNLTHNDSGNYVTSVIDATSGATNRSDVSLPPSYDILVTIEKILYTKVAAVICVLGLVGNILNMAVLTRRRLQAGMTRMERTVYLGLAALALSDMMFCACALPHAWVPTHSFYFRSAGFAFLYSLYSDALINIFVMSSTWLTVAMATSRYVAICHPLHARCLISGCRAKISIIVIFLLCTLFNLPRFWNHSTDTMLCAGGWTAYFRFTGPFKTHETLYITYMCVYFVVASVVPFILLFFCNACLVRALRHSLGMRIGGQGHMMSRTIPTSTSATSASAIAGQADTHRTSLTLILIVLMYFLLVLPAEVSNFLRLVIIQTPSLTSAYNVVVAVLNVLQASNFAFHFVLYCVVNVHFRHSMRAAFICDRKKKDKCIVLRDFEQVVPLTNGETTTAATTL